MRWMNWNNNRWQVHFSFKVRHALIRSDLRLSFGDKRLLQLAQYAIHFGKVGSRLVWAKVLLWDPNRSFSFMIVSSAVFLSLVCGSASQATGSNSPPIAGSLAAGVYYVVSSTSQEVGDYKCDGVDDHIEIQQAIAAATAVGSAVRLSAGVFNVNAQINMTSNLVMYGETMQTTIVKLIDDARPFKFGPSAYAGLLRGNKINNVQVSDMCFDGNKENNVGKKGEDSFYGRYGFYCEACNDVSLIRMTMQNHGGYGFDPHGVPGELVYSENLLIRDCLAQNNG